MEQLITTNTHLAQFLRQQRKSSGMSQSEVSGRSGLLPKTISLLENHPEKCSIATLMKYLSYLNMEIVLQSKPKDSGSNRTGKW